MNEKVNPLEIRPIVLSGVARSGKDTFCNLLIEYLADKGVKAKRLALADKLKEELDGFLMANLNISAFTQNPDEKKLIRPILVEYGRVKRIVSNGTHWTSTLEPSVISAINNGIVPIITDARYSEYEKDEIWWAKNKINGILVHISRTDIFGNLVLPPNIDEAKNDPLIQAEADHKIEWESKNDVSMLSLGKYIERFAKSFLKY